MRRPTRLADAASQDGTVKGEIRQVMVHAGCQPEGCCSDCLSDGLNRFVCGGMSVANVLKADECMAAASTMSASACQRRPRQGAQRAPARFGTPRCHRLG